MLLITATFLLQGERQVDERSSMISTPDEYDRPLGNLDGLKRIQFEKTQLEGVAAEVRFLPNKPELSEAEAIHVWEGFGKSELPIFERQTMNVLNLNINPSGHEQSHQTQQGWVLASADRRMAITLFPSVVAVNRSTYSHYRTSIGEPLTKTLRLFVEATEVSVVQRIGLRYVNRLRDARATTPGYWSEHVRPEFAGPLVGDIAPLVAALHQQLQLRLDETTAARIQSGVFREQSPEEHFSFLVDLDVFREQAIDFDEGLCANLTRQLNRTALALFAHVLSDEYLSQMQPGPIEGEFL